MDAYSHFYPDVKFDDIVREDVRDTVRRLADLCSAFPQERPVLIEMAKTLGEEPVLPDMASGAFGQRLKENNADRIIDVPVLIAQGLADVCSLR